MIPSAKQIDVGSANPQTEFLYRFRSARALLEDYEELEKQEIYFASPNELNDPLEGYKEVFWRGDEILWPNLLRHYILCLMNEVLLSKLSLPDDARPDVSFMRGTEETLPTRELRALYKRAVTVFNRHPDIDKFVASLCRRKGLLRSAELTTYLRLLHHHALNSVITVMEEDMPGLSRRTEEDPLRSASLRPLACAMMSEHLEKAEAEPTSIQGLAEALGVADSLVADQQFLLARYQKPEVFSKNLMWYGVFVEFPTRYVQQLDELLYSNWYTACFVRDPTQAAMWGNYSDGHKGVCLQFRTAKALANYPALTFNQQVGLGSAKAGPEPIFGDVMHKCYPVRYQPKFVEVDFFRSLGTLNRSMMNFWFRNENGTVSERVADILTESEQWRSSYWETSANTTTTKLSDWSYEAEYRAVLQGSLIDFSNKLDRKLKYRFEDLEGIVFGARTSTADKLEIMAIIEKKCENAGRTSFAFQQARFSTASGKFEIVPLTLLNAIVDKSHNRNATPPSVAQDSSRSDV